MPMIILSVDAINTHNGRVGVIHLHEMSDVLHVLEFIENDIIDNDFDNNDNDNGNGNNYNNACLYDTECEENGHILKQKKDDDNNDNKDSNIPDANFIEEQQHKINNDDNDNHNGNKKNSNSISSFKKRSMGSRAIPRDILIPTLQSFCVDLDDMEMHEDSRKVIFMFEDYRHNDYNDNNNMMPTFQITSSFDFKILKEAVLECQDLCRMALRMESISRELYYAGVYSEFSKDNKLLIGDELQGLFASSRVENDEYIFRLNDDLDFCETGQKGFSNLGNNQLKYNSYKEKYKAKVCIIYFAGHL